ncbi:MAG TPA: type II toxin-antitoxin system prevent-host-death family antitoxin [Chloroflexota bacterium]|nr:type II toxin-antitoxin system prevent-host-death family antitoxin [Chloroflexota bacterium]
MVSVAASEVSKAQFKAHVLEILRRVEATGEPVIVTDRGRPVVRVEPYFGGDDSALAALRGSVLAYEDPLEPAAKDAWEALV